MIEWFEAIEQIQPHVVRVWTPGGSGSGFFLARLKSQPICAIATAAHVVNHAHYWEEPIRIEHLATGKTTLVRIGSRAILIDSDRDTAAVLFEPGEIAFPDEPLPLVEKGRHLKVGNNIGWLGFPAIPAASLCFFGGRISAWLGDQRAYLVDGVAINGVSGGPAVWLPLDGKPALRVAGVVTAYVPNRATGEALPGLSIVSDVAQFHDVIPRFKSLDEAKAQEKTADEPPKGSSGEAGAVTRIRSRWRVPEHALRLLQMAGPPPRGSPVHQAVDGDLPQPAAPARRRRGRGPALDGALRGSSTGSSTRRSASPTSGSCSSRAARFRNSILSRERTDGATTAYKDMLKSMLSGFGADD